jgi:hypothetical protein
MAFPSVAVMGFSAFLFRLKHDQLPYTENLMACLNHENRYGDVGSTLRVLPLSIFNCQQWAGPPQIVLPCSMASTKSQICPDFDAVLCSP